MIQKPAVHQKNTDKLKEECGVFGICFPSSEQVSRLIYFGLVALQHRGQESAGIAVTNGNGIYIFKGLGLVSQVFKDERLMEDLRGSLGIGHVRYSTTGSTTERNAQPLLGLASSPRPQLRLDFAGAHTPVGEQLVVEASSEPHVGSTVVYKKDAQIALAHNGNLVNAPELRVHLSSLGYHFETTTDTEVIVHLIDQQLGKNPKAWHEPSSLLDAVRNALAEIRGAYALLIMTPGYLIAARDPRGIRPLVFGTMPSGGFVFASETCALDIVGARFKRDVNKGECLLVGESPELQISRKIPRVNDGSLALCIFETVYFARPDSEFGGLVVQDARERMGAILAREHPVDADFVVPIPDSGTPAAIGYADAIGIKYYPGLIKNRYIPRTFIQPDQRLREQGIRLKLNPLRKRVAGKRVVLVDDSIVRGTTIRQIVRLLRDVGVSELHVRVSCPPIKWPCYYGIDTSCRSDLIASAKTTDEICQYIGADSLEYLSLEGLLEATGGTRQEGYCLACLNGEYPVKPPSQEAALGKMAFEEVS